MLDMPGGGAAGGFGAGAAALLNARLRPGVEMLLDAADFPRLAADADLIITGEGRLDSQSLGGKAVIGVARRARELGVPCAALAGAVDVSALPRAYELGLTAAFPINPLPLPFEQVRFPAGKICPPQRRISSVFIALSLGDSNQKLNAKTPLLY